MSANFYDGVDVKVSMRLGVSVAWWELRRLLSSWTNLGLVLCAIGLSSALVLFKHSWFVPVEATSGRSVPITVFGSTGLGALYETTTSLAFLGMVVIFIAADGVAHDRRQRVHEMLMAGPLGTFAYVLGRFAAVMLACLGLSLLIAATIAGTDLLIHVQNPNFPVPNITALALDWAVVAVPSVALLAGLSFMAATLKPMLATAIKLGVVLLWLSISVVVDLGHFAPWLRDWMPGGIGELKSVPDAVVAQYAALVGTGRLTSALELRAQQPVPDLSQFVGPHIGLTLIAIALAVIAAWQFRRFRNALS